MSSIEMNRVIDESDESISEHGSSVGSAIECTEKNGSEMTAAAALAGLVGSPNHVSEDDDLDDEEPQVDSKGFTIPQRFTKSGRKRAVSFVLKLMKVLSCKEYTDIITWMPSGKSFTIVNPKAFVAQILPHHFKSAKYSSFTRKLHRWGFMRHYRGEEAGAFFHKNFQKGRLDLVEKMSCNKTDVPKTSVSMASQRKVEVASPASLSKMDEVASRPSDFSSRPVLQMQAPMQAPSPSQHLLQSAFTRPIAQPQMHNFDLDAAIELEVARRLKERIHAATMKRQALALMQQLESSAVPIVRPNLLSWGQQPSLPTQLGGLNLNHNAQSLYKIETLLRESNLSQLPATNIQSAKTA